MFKSFLLSQIAAFGAASTIYRECLEYTDATGRDAFQPRKFEHYGMDVREMPLFDSSMRVSQVKVCLGSNTDRVKGFSFTLSDPTGANSDTVDIPLLGKERGDCETFDVDTPINRIKAALSRDMKYIDGIAFLRDGEVNFDDFGSINNPLKRWNFSDDRPVIAYYGKINEDEQRIK